MDELIFSFCVRGRLFFTHLSSGDFTTVSMSSFGANAASQTSFPLTLLACGLVDLP